MRLKSTCTGEGNDFINVRKCPVKCRFPLKKKINEIKIISKPNTNGFSRGVSGVVLSAPTWIPMDERGVLRYSSALDTSTALSHVWTELWLPSDACLLPAVDSIAMVTALALSRLSMEL